MIRPAVVLRMPNFHMSSDEASKLVDYFAAKSNSEFPYEYNNRRRRGYMAELEQIAPGAAERRDEDRHERQLLREVPFAWRLPGEGLRRRGLVRIWIRFTGDCGPIICGGGSAIRSASCRTRACR